MKYVTGSNSSEAGEEAAGCQVTGTQGPVCAIPGTATLLPAFSCHGHKYLHSFFFFFIALFLLILFEAIALFLNGLSKITQLLFNLADCFFF